MLRPLTKTWWLLALCGILDALNAGMNLLTISPENSVALRRFALPGTVTNMAVLALAAGVCALAAGVWTAGRDKSWLIALHGLTLGGYGLLFFTPVVRGPLSFRPVSLLFVVMAVSLGAFALATARSGAPGRTFLTVTGVTSIGFALSFFAVGFGWVGLAGPHSFLDLDELVFRSVRGSYALAGAVGQA